MMASNDYENIIIEIKLLMCRIPFRNTVLVLYLCYKSNVLISFTVVRFCPSLKAQTRSQ